MDTILERLKGITSNFTPRQLATIGPAFLIVVGIVAGSAWYLNTPDYVLLFSDMDADSAAQVVSRLKSMKVSYRIDPGGGAIRVPSDQADELRMEIGEKTLTEIAIRGPFGVEVIPASSGSQSITSMTAARRSVLREALVAFAARLEYLLIDTAAGISDNVIETLRTAEREALVTSLEPSAVVDAYATAKILTQTSPDIEIGVGVNAVRDGNEARLAFKQLDVGASRFLGRNLRYYRFVAEDKAARDAVMAQRAVVDHVPQAVASRCFRILASRLAGLGRGPGGLRFMTPGVISAGGAGNLPGGLQEVPKCA